MQHSNSPNKKHNIKRAYSGYCRYLNKSDSPSTRNKAKRIHVSVPKPVEEKEEMLRIPESDSEYAERTTEEVEVEFKEERFAQVVLHEIDHAVQRLDHRDMLDWWNMETPDVETVNVRKKQEWK